MNRIGRPPSATPCIPKLVVTFWTAGASEARRRFGVRPAERSTRISDPRAAQSAVAAALCQRSPYPSVRSSPTNNFGMHRAPPPPVLVGRQRPQKDLGFDPALSLKTLISALIWGFLDESRYDSSECRFDN